jgi:hypothetical protein
LAADARIQLPVSAKVRNLFVVFFAPGKNDPKFDQLKARIVPFFDSLLGEPMSSLAREFAQSRLHLQLVKRSDLPPVPVGLLRHVGLGEVEERKLEASSLALLIEAEEGNRPPRAGLWTALAAAQACAQILRGTVFDPAASRVIRVAPSPSELTADGSIAIARHIVVPFSIGERGLGWMTTSGMAKFGLIDLEVRDVPPNLQGLAYLVNALAQHLLDLLDGSRLDGDQEVLDLPSSLRIGPQDLARASGGKDAASEVEVGLELTSPSAPNQPPFLRLVRPDGVRASHGAWLFDTLEQFIGSQPSVMDADTSGDAMQAAHRRAVAELPRIKNRFVRGLRPGETLYVKHGFPAGRRGKEYMWVVVNRWTGTDLHGQLVNNARDSKLRAGHEVDLTETDVFDWVLELPHGEHEGGYTTDVLLGAGQP